ETYSKSRRLPIADPVTPSPSASMRTGKPECNRKPQSRMTASRMKLDNSHSVKELVHSDQYDHCGGEGDDDIGEGFITEGACSKIAICFASARRKSRAGFRIQRCNSLFDTHKLNAYGGKRVAGLRTAKGM